MKKFTEKDIENMLSKTEKTEPSFDKGVVFERRALVPKRKTRFISVLTAACLLMLALVVTPVFLIASRNSDYSNASIENSFSQFVSGVSYYPVDESEINSNNSYAFPDDSGGYMSTAGESSEGDTESSEIVVPILPTVEYPDDYAFYVAQGLNGNQTPEEYFDLNPNKYLGAKINLPVYKRTTLSVEERRKIIDNFAESIDTVLEFDDDLFEITGDCRGISKSGNFSMNVGEFGDWYFAVKNNNFMRLEITSDSFIEFCDRTETFVTENREFFGNVEYRYSVDKNGENYYVSVTDFSNSDSVISKMTKYSFEYKCLYGNVYALVSVRHTSFGEIMGEYKTRLYDSALREMFDNKFYGEYGFIFSQGDEFVIVGYDVRYLTANQEALVCPYYAFVIDVSPNSEENEYRTVFVPAILGEYIAEESE